MPVRVHMHDGLVVARLEVGTTVYVCVGPPLEVQLQGEYAQYVYCPSEEVKKAERFAAAQSKRTASHDRQQRRDFAELDEM